MGYKKLGETFYIRVDRGDEAVASILEVCRQEGVKSAVFSGIGGCSSAELQVFIPETGAFETEQLEGMLELVSLNGNVFRTRPASSIIIRMHCSRLKTTGNMAWRADI